MFDHSPTLCMKGLTTIGPIRLFLYDEDISLKWVKLSKLARRKVKFQRKVENFVLRKENERD